MTWSPVPALPCLLIVALSALAEPGGKWIRIKVGDRVLEQNAEDRVHTVSYEELAAVEPDLRAGVPVAALRLLAGPMDSLPRALGAPVRDRESHPNRLREIPMEVMDDGDGVWDAGDRLRFYGQGTGTWTRLPGAAGPVRYAFASDPYSFDSYYFLAWSGGEGAPLRLAETPAPEGAGEARTVTRHYLRAEQDKGTGGCETVGIWDGQAGFRWFWHRRTLCKSRPDTVLSATQLGSPSVQSLADFARPEAGRDAVLIGLHFFPMEDGEDMFRVRMAGRSEPLAAAPQGKEVPGAWYAWDGPGGGDAAFAAGSEAFRMESLEWERFSAATLFDGYSVSYPRRLAWRGAPLWIFPEGGPASYAVEGAGGLLCVRVVGGVADRLWRLGPRGRFSDSLPDGADVRYLIWKDAASLPKESFAPERIPAEGKGIRDLWTGDGETPEYLILASRELAAPALALRDFRRDARRSRPLKASVALVEDVYREFSGGRPSPTGIRDFLRWARQGWGGTLGHVLLFGSGHFDYRGIQAAGSKDAFPMHVPPYEWHSGGEAIASDDFYARLDSGETDSQSGGLDLAIGRVPARDAAQAMAYVDKVKAWEDPSKSGAWRARAVLAADDHLQRDKDNNDLDGIREGHVNHSEAIGKGMTDRDAGLVAERVYLLDYPLNSSYRKPEASQDLISLLNQGSLVLNYVGHGSPNQWADEVLLQTGDAMTTLENHGRTGMVNSFSCAVGRYDAFLPGLSEALVMRPSTGAIAAVAATRESYPDPNVALAKAFYAHAFGDSGAAPLTMGESLRNAKNLRTEYPNGVNDAKYSLLGEPVLRLRRTGLTLSMARGPDTVRALDCGTLEGTVAGGSGSGFLNVKLVGGAIHKDYVLPSPMIAQAADRRGAILFEQTVPYRDGRFKLDYFFPARLPFGDSTASLVAFAWDGTREMEGGTASRGLRVQGAANRSAGAGGCGEGSDGKGPRIHIAGCEAKEAGGMDLPDRIRLAMPSCLQITVTDSGGGVATADGPDEGTTLEVPGVLDPYHPVPGVDELYRKTYKLALLPRDFRAGSHVLKVTAEDGYGNRSLRVLRMDLGSDSSIQALAVHNAPNPVKGSGTAFYFSALLPTADAEVTEGGGEAQARTEFEVRIFDQAGRLVKSLRQARSGVRWEGRDEWGNRLGNGVYYYSVTARWNQADGAPQPGFRTVTTRRNTLVLSR